MFSGSGGEFLRHQFPTPEWLVDGLVPGTGWGLIVAPPKYGKTILMAQLAFALISGSNFLTWRVPVPKRVCFVQGDAPIEEFQYQVATVRQWSEAADGAVDRLHVVEARGSLLGVGEAQRVWAEINRAKPDYIIFDALESLSEGDLNTLETRKIVRALRNLAQGLPFGVIHHPRKQLMTKQGPLHEGVRNSAAGHHFLTANASLIMELEPRSAGKAWLHYIRRRGAEDKLGIHRVTLPGRPDCAVWEHAEADQAADPSASVGEGVDEGYINGEVGQEQRERWQRRSRGGD